MINGSCLCGSVAYEAGPLTAPIGHCHCRTCQKAHSAAFATAARTSQAAFRWTRGAEGLADLATVPNPEDVGRLISKLVTNFVVANDQATHLDVELIEPHAQTRKFSQTLWRSRQRLERAGGRDRILRG